MPLFQDVREKYPQYNDLSDQELGRALHKKFYSDMPYKTFIQSAIAAAYPRQTTIGQAAEEAVAKHAAGLSPVEKWLIGTRESTRTAAGRIAGLFGDKESATQAARERELTKHVTGLAATGGRLLPIIAGTARVPGKFLPSTAAGVATGALTADNPNVGAVLGGLGGAAGVALGGALGRGGNALAGKWATRSIQGSDDTAAAMKAFQTMGGRVTPGQASGGNVARMFDNAMTSNPFTASGFRSIAESNRKLVTRLAAKAVGITSDDLGPTALRAADDVISQQFDDVARMVDDIPVADLSDDIIRLLRKGDVKPYLDDLAAGQISGRAYMNIRSKLLHITRGSSDKVDDAWDVIDELDDIVEGIAPQGYKQAYAAARERFKSMLALEKYRRAVTGGEVNAPTLDGAMQRIFGKQYTRDMPTILPETKQLFTAVRALADPRMAAHLGGSPTAERVIPSLILGGAMFNPQIAGLAGAGWLGSRAALAAPAPLAAQIGGAAGRATPNILAPQK